MYYTKKIINQNNLLSNFDYVQKTSKKNICAVVKANAYGHGDKNVVKILDKKASFFSVQNLAEALNVRKHTNKSILILGYCYDIKMAIENNISIMVDSIETLKQISRIKTNKNAKIHIKINTGMNRLGIKKIKQFKQFLKIINSNKNIVFEGIYTHCFSAKNKKITQKQIDRFLKFVDKIPTRYNVIKHIGGSNLIYYNLPKQIDCIRVGIMLYGYGDEKLKPVMQITSQVVKVFEIKKGEYVGYEEKFRATQKTKIAVVALGYADGFFKQLAYKKTFFICGKNCKILGPVCMDMFMLDVTETNIKVGDCVLIFQNATNWAKMLDKTEYEILTGFNQTRCDENVV